MLLFRSEEHVDRWTGQRGVPKGVAFGTDQLWGLAEAWYRERMSPHDRRRTPGEAEALFASLGLTGDFWKLT
jgi:hypothetical protein